jgi:D-alanyl-D-alanine dipeptidase
MKPKAPLLPHYQLKGFEQKVPTPGYDSSTTVPMVDLEEISQRLEHPFCFDIRYARTDNFFKRAVYSSPRAFLLESVALDLIRVHQSLHRHGYGLLIFDGYRPWSVSKLFYDECQPFERDFLADPAQGSSHNRGCALDLSMYHLESGAPVKMPSDFDEMNERAYTEYAEGPEEPRRARDLLQSSMRQHHFTPIRLEWWHFNHVSHQRWPVMNHSFDEILGSPKSIPDIESSA